MRVIAELLEIIFLSLVMDQDVLHFDCPLLFKKISKNCLT